MFLLSFPSGGPMIDGLRRKLIVTGSPYVLVYRTSGNDIEILRLFHQSEDWRAKL